MMVRVFLIAAFVLVSLPIESLVYGDEISVSEKDWAWWRGPGRDGIADSNQSPPLEWSETENVLWKESVPGRGHGSPIVVRDRIFLATADEEREVQSVLCYDRETGEPLWKTDVHRGGFEAVGRQGNPRSTRASSTLASDGHRVFINFFNSNAVYVTALDFDGKQLWQKKVTDYAMHQGYGSSPTVYGSLLIVSADNTGGGAVTAYDRVSGDVVWTVKRAELPNYASPIILNIDGRDELVFTGHDMISSFDPMTGSVNYEVKGATTECVTSVVSDGEYLVTSGGYPDKHIAVVKADGSGEEVWRTGVEVYVPSMLMVDGHIYGVTDGGSVFCYSLESATPVWEKRLRGKFSGSPVLVGENIFVTSMKGTTYIFKATPEGFELVGENVIAADQQEATPVICDSRIYMRIPRKEGEKRQEMLYCIGKQEG